MGKNKEDKKPMTPEEKLKVTKRGKDVGKIGMAVGATTMAGSIIPGAMTKLKHGAEHIETAGGIMSPKKLRVAGGALAATSAGLYGYSAYKHHKLKKEQEKDDNSKK